MNSKLRFPAQTFGGVCADVVTPKSFVLTNVCVLTFLNKLTEKNIVFQVFLPESFADTSPPHRFAPELKSQLPVWSEHKTRCSFCFSSSKASVSVSERKLGYRLVIGRSLANERWVSQSDLPLVVVFGFRRSHRGAAGCWWEAAWQLISDWFLVSCILWPVF